MILPVMGQHLGPQGSAWKNTFGVFSATLRYALLRTALDENHEKNQQGGYVQ